MEDEFLLFVIASFVEKFFRISKNNSSFFLFYYRRCLLYSRFFFPSSFLWRMEEGKKRDLILYYSPLPTFFLSS